MAFDLIEDLIFLVVFVCCDCLFDCLDVTLKLTDSNQVLVFLALLSVLIKDYLLVETEIWFFGLFLFWERYVLLYYL